MAVIILDFIINPAASANYCFRSFKSIVLSLIWSYSMSREHPGGQWSLQKILPDWGIDKFSCKRRDEFLQYLFSKFDTKIKSSPQRQENGWTHLYICYHWFNDKFMPVLTIVSITAQPRMPNWSCRETSDDHRYRFRLAVCTTSFKQRTWFSR